MILKYIITDNMLIKENPLDYPTHLQDNITLQFKDNDGLVNDKTYAFIKTPNHIEKIKINNENGIHTCKLPKSITNETFFTLKVLIIDNDNHKMFTNEIIIPAKETSQTGFRLANDIIDRCAAML